MTGLRQAAMMGGRVLAATMALALVAAPAVARDVVRIAGSSTVLPFAVIVAEAFGEETAFPAPVVEGGGSGTGRARLCGGLGEATLDIANSSSRITAGDLAACAANGAGGVIEVRFGIDGIVLASDADGPAYALNAADLYTALAAEVVEDGILVPNRLHSWAEVNPDLPAQRILALIPGTRHGSRETFDAEILRKGCEATGARAAFLARGDSAGAARRACTTLRRDGAAVEIDGDYTETLARLEADPVALGVFGLSFFLNNTGRLRAATIDGVEPSPRTVALGTYPVVRPLWFYVKIAHLDVIPGLQAYVDFFLSDAIAGPGGLLEEYGLVPDPNLAQTRAMVARREPVVLP